MGARDEVMMSVRDEACYRAVPVDKNANITYARVKLHPDYEQIALPQEPLYDVGNID